MAKLTAGNSQTAISTELNSLANGSAAAGTTVVDNSVNLDPWGSLNAVFVFATTPTAGTTMDVYRVPEFDGTNYDTIDTGNLPQIALFVGSFIVTSTGTTQHLSLEFLTLGNKKWKYSVKNNSGVALAASGSSVTLYSWQTQ